MNGSIVIDRKKLASSLVAFSILIMTALCSVYAAPAQAGISAASSRYTVMCSLPNGDDAGGLYYSRTPDINGTTAGAWIEDENTGSIYWCSVDTTTATLIATAPSGAQGGGYYGMGGWDSYTGNTFNSTRGATLVLTSQPEQGMYFCRYPTNDECKNGESAFIPFPTGYCSKLRTHFCDPRGTVMDAQLNVYWVDPANAVFVKCTAASQYSSCTTLPASADLADYAPTGLALVNGTSPYLKPGWSFFISDASCAGLVWSGTTSKLNVVASLNDSLGAIGSTTDDVGYTQQVVVGDTGFCSGNRASLLDISNPSQQIETDFDNPVNISGITTCVGQCLQEKPNSRHLFFTAGDSAYQGYGNSTTSSTSTSCSTATSESNSTSTSISYSTTTSSLTNSTSTQSSTNSTGSSTTTTMPTNSTSTTSTNSTTTASTNSTSTSTNSTNSTTTSFTNSTSTSISYSTTTSSLTNSTSTQSSTNSTTSSTSTSITNSTTLSTSTTISSNSTSTSPFNSTSSTAGSTTSTSLTGDVLAEQLARVAATRADECGTVLFNIELKPSDKNAHLISASNSFQVNYTSEGVLKSAAYLGPTMSLQVDANSLLVISGRSSGSSPTEQWCFEEGCLSLSWQVGMNGGSVDLKYFDVLSQVVSSQILGGGNPLIRLTYTAMPIVAGSNQAITELTLSPNPATIFAVRGSEAFVPTNAGVNSTDRWHASGRVSWAILQPDVVSNPVTYMHQFFVSFASAPSNGGSVKPSVSTWLSAGKTIAISATANSGFRFSSWSTSNPEIVIANPSESKTKATVNGAGTITATFVR